MRVDQTAFRSAILDPDRAVPHGLVDPEGRAAGKRFDVYRNNVVVSLTAALAEAFPVVKKLLGINNFGILARSFVRQHPPRSPQIAFYGEAMPRFLETFAPVRSLGYLPDVARLELALRRSYHAADSDPVDPTALLGLPPERLMSVRLALAPALRVVPSDWPIVAIWRFNMEDGPKPEMAAETALITRPEFDPQIVALPPAGGRFVAALAAGGPLGAALTAAAELEPGFNLPETLAALIGGDAITAIKEE